MLPLSILILGALYATAAQSEPLRAHPNVTAIREHHRAHRRTRPLQVCNKAVSTTSNLNTRIHAALLEETLYSTNWAGAVIALDPSTDTNTNTSTNTNTTRFTSISATITVPTPAPLPANSTDYQTASAWIGLDGGESHTSTTSTTTTTTNAILQTGVDLYVIDGQAYTDPWYEWYPDFARYYDEFVVNPGDELGVSVTADPGGRVGVCVVENRSSGASVTQTLTAPKSTATLAGRTAEWVVEGFASALDEADAVPFVGFEPAVGFRECAAVAGGKAYSLLDATALYEIVLPGDGGDRVGTRVQVLPDGDGMTVTRVGALRYGVELR